MTRYTEGFSHFITSMTAPVASGWSDGRVGLAPTGKAPPYHGAHPKPTLALPTGVELWSLTTLREKLVKIGAKVGHFSACRDRDSTAVVRGDPATDRRPGAEASTDMTPHVINAIGLNRRAPGARHLPNGRLHSFQE